MRGGGQRVPLLEQGGLSPVFHCSGPGRVQFAIGLEFSGNIVLGVDRLDRAFRDARGAIDAIIRMNYEAVLQLIEASDGTDLDAVGELAALTFARDDMCDNCGGTVNYRFGASGLGLWLVRE